MTRLGHDVLGLDIDEHRVDCLAQDITHAVIAEATMQLHELGVRISQELNCPMVHDYLGLGDDYCVVELHATVGPQKNRQINPPRLLLESFLALISAHPETCIFSQFSSPLEVGAELSALKNSGVAK
jgi:hypothetical protein